MLERLWQTISEVLCYVFDRCKNLTLALYKVDRTLLQGLSLSLESPFQNVNSILLWNRHYTRYNSNDWVQVLDLLNIERLSGYQATLTVWYDRHEVLGYRFSLGHENLLVLELIYQTKKENYRLCWYRFTGMSDAFVGEEPVCGSGQELLAVSEKVSISHDEFKEGLGGQMIVVLEVILTENLLD